MHLHSTCVIRLYPCTHAFFLLDEMSLGMRLAKGSLLHKCPIFIQSISIIIITIIIIIALQHSEDLDRVNEEQKLVLNEDES